MLKLKSPLVALVAFLLYSTAIAFDTGHHFDLTRSVLSEHGFSDDAIKVVQVENWLTDYYSIRPYIKVGLDKKKIVENRIKTFEKLHFDNLTTTDDVDRYWAQFSANLKEAVQNAARTRNDLEMLTVLGVGLHATQDFYSHSNWVELHPHIGDTFRAETYGPLRSGLHTGSFPAKCKPKEADELTKHGSYSCGLNHDSTDRPGWDEAYVFSYVASHELVSAMKQWSDEIDPTFWSSVTRYAATNAVAKDLADDLNASRNMSMWINVAGANGHWKGAGSGTIAYNLSLAKWVATDSSIFVRAIRDTQLVDRIANKLYTAGPTPKFTPFPRFALDKTAIIVHTLSASEVGGGIGPRGPDMYAITTINGQTFDGRVLQNKRTNPKPWREIAFIDTNSKTVPISVAVFDEDGPKRAGDPQININLLAGKRDLNVIFSPTTQLISGDVNGKFDSTAPLRSSGTRTDGKAAAVELVVTTAKLQ